MLLCKADVKRLENAGHSRKSFVHVGRQGFSHLKNTEGYCFFYDRTKNCCRAYEHRPLGCRVYPVIYSDQNGIIIDDLCPMQATVTCREIRQKGKVVIRLLQTIDNEAKAAFLLHKADKQS
jgi:Fe-S-cluster containining protein